MACVWVWKVTCVLSGVVPPFITASDADAAMEKVKAHLVRREVSISAIQGLERIAHFNASDAAQAELFASTEGN